MFQIKTSIENDYKQQYNRAISDVKSALDSRCYSLLFHRLGNSSIVEISINYWLDGSDRINGISANQILGISKNCTNFLLSFGESLSNCSAFVVDFDLKNDLTGTEVQGKCSDRIDPTVTISIDFSSSFHRAHFGYSSHTNIFICHKNGIRSVLAIVSNSNSR